MQEITPERRKKIQKALKRKAHQIVLRQRYLERPKLYVKLLYWKIKVLRLKIIGWVMGYGED